MYTNDSMARVPFKKTLGKSHTSNSRDPANEPFASNFQVAAQHIWANTIYPVPTHILNENIVSELVILKLVPIIGTEASNGIYTSYYCSIGDDVPTTLQNKINKLTGNIYQPNDKVGDIISDAYGLDFRPKLYNGLIETPPLDASDWFLDCFSGIITQETDSLENMIDYSTDGSLRAYIYIGNYVDQMIAHIDGGSF